MAFDPLLGDPTTPVGLRKHLKRRLQGMRATRGYQDTYWMELARFCSPTLGRFISAYSERGGAVSGVTVKQADRLNNKLLDSRAVWASDVLANGMHSGLTHPSRPWFKLKLEDDDLMQFQDVKTHIDVVEKRLYDFFNGTNFYTSAKSGYRELGIFGVEAGFFESHWQYGGVVHPLTVGEYWIGLNDALVADSLYRRVDMTTLQHYERFLKDKLQGGGSQIDYLPRKVVEAYSKGEYDRTFEVYHAVEPNTLRDPSRMDHAGKAYRSVYWSEAIDGAEENMPRKALLAEEGYASKPFWAPRWDVTGGDTYGSHSPGMNGYADVRQLQLSVLRKQQAIDYTIKPPLAGPATLNNVHAALQPGRVTAMAGIDKDNFGPIWQIPTGALQYIIQDTTETREMVDRSFYVDLFNAITNMQGIQPRNIEEIASRNEEKLTQLGPVVERVNQEKLQVAVERAYDILDRHNVLPPAPEELDGVPIKIEFVSVLAQAQRMIGLGGIERTAGFISSLMAGGFAEAGDSFDADAAIAEYADIVGADSKLIRTAEQIKAIREGRAQQQQAAQQAEALATMAPAAKQGAEAAKILYDSPGVGSDPSLAQRLLGV